MASMRFDTHYMHANIIKIPVACVSTIDCTEHIDMSIMQWVERVGHTVVRPQHDTFNQHIYI